MNIYESQYREKLVTLEEALDSLRDGDVIGTSQCANEPTAFFDAMHTLRGKGKKYRMFAPMCFQHHLPDGRHPQGTGGGALQLLSRGSAQRRAPVAQRPRLRRVHRRGNPHGQARLYEDPPVPDP